MLQFPCTIYTITDAEISVNVPESVQENMGHLTVCAMLDSPAGGLEDNLTISFDVSNKTSEFLVNKTLVAGTQINSGKCFNLTLEDDEIFDDNSTVTVHSYSMLSRVMILNNTVHTKVIDNDGKFTTNLSYIFFHATACGINDFHLHFRSRTSTRQLW